MLRVEQWPIDRLIPYEGNPRKNDDAVERMCDAIREFGFRIPIVAGSDGIVVDGHLRLKAAQQLGLETVPVALADDLTDAQIKAFRLLANRSASWAEWDEGLLAKELHDLQDIGFDLALTGFGQDELSELLAEAAGDLNEPEAAPTLEPEPVSRPGDLWVLGRHRLLCGDCTDAAAVELLLAGERPQLMVTDPPYGVAYDPSWREGVDLGVGERSKGKVANDDRADWREAWALFPGDVAYVWHGGLHAATVAESLSACRFELRSQIIWAKQHFVISRGDYHWKHEPCWYAVRKGATSGWAGDRKQTTVWEIANNNSFGNGNAEETWGHGTQKPVECMKRPIENSSSAGEAIYEPFSGSGTTIIAAEATGRRCFALEIDRAYVDVAVRRWQATTGKTAVLADNGCSFAEVEAARVGT